MGKEFLLILKNSNTTTCVSSHPLKLKNLTFCNKQWLAKIKFLFTERSTPGKNPVDLWLPI